MAISVTVSQKDLDYLDYSLVGIANGAKVAIRSAITDTLKSERAEMVRDAKGKINLTATEIRSRIVIGSWPHSFSLSGELVVKHSGVPLDEYNRQAKVRAAKGTGVTAIMIPGKGPLTFRHGFGATLDTGHKGFLYRRGEKRPAKRGKYKGKVYQRGPRKGQLILRQAVVDIRGAPVVAVYEQFPQILDKVATDTADKFHTRLISKVDWLLHHNNTNFGS